MVLWVSVSRRKLEPVRLCGTCPTTNLDPGAGPTHGLISCSQKKYVYRRECLLGPGAIYNCDSLFLLNRTLKGLTQLSIRFELR